MYTANIEAQGEYETMGLYVDNLYIMSVLKTSLEFISFRFSLSWSRLMHFSLRTSTAACLGTAQLESEHSISNKKTYNTNPSTHHDSRFFTVGWQHLLQGHFVVDVVTIIELKLEMK